MNKIFFQQVAEQTIYFQLFAEQYAPYFLDILSTFCFDMTTLPFSAPSSASSIIVFYST